MKKRLNKRGGFTDLFVFMIIAFVLIIISGVLIYITTSATDEIRENIGNLGLKGDGTNNATQTFENTMGKANLSFNALYWVSILVIFGMIFGVFIGSYMVTTKPIFFVPYIFIVIIAVIVAVPISNAYETIALNPTLNSTFMGFTGSNWIMAKLPIIVGIIGIVGGIIMFVRMGGKKEEAYYGY